MSVVAPLDSNRTDDSRPRVDADFGSKGTTEWGEEERGVGGGTPGSVVDPGLWAHYSISSGGRIGGKGEG